MPVPETVGALAAASGLAVDEVIRQLNHLAERLRGIALSMQDFTSLKMGMPQSHWILLDVNLAGGAALQPEAVPIRDIFDFRRFLREHSPQTTMVTVADDEARAMSGALYLREEGVKKAFYLKQPDIQTNQAERKQ